MLVGAPAGLTSYSYSHAQCSTLTASVGEPQAGRLCVISVCLPEVSGTGPRHGALTKPTVVPSWYVNVFPKMTSRPTLSGLPR